MSRKGLACHGRPQKGAEGRPYAVSMQMPSGARTTRAHRPKGTSARVQSGDLGIDPWGHNPNAPTS